MKEKDTLSSICHKQLNNSLLPDTVSTSTLPICQPLLPVIGYIQFSSRSPGTRSNSAVLLVTRINPIDLAWPAIIIS